MIDRRRREPLGSALVAFVLAVAAVAGTPAGRVAAAPGYELDLYRSGDFVAQTNLVQCVGASMQMMINIIAARDDRTAETQHRLWLLARSFRSIPVRPGRQGASVRGWSLGLNELGYGPYRVAGFSTLEAATRAAARAIRVTGKPVGLLVWGGRHAWVMSGFTATADPLATDEFRVTHARVLDPLYPRHSTTWGRSPEPGTSLTLETLGASFIPRRRRPIGSDGVPVAAPSLAGKWVLVVPASVAPPRLQTQRLVD
ncbi:MAG TPA: hypothetical protein VGQ47_03965 [Candidatus Limnocylindrales bacterium]|nr:hypothetical protein [Candidatus Limnocylindrales bacterium]